MEMLKAKTKKFNGRSYKISPLKEGPYKKGLVKNLMKARREVKVALDKKVRRTIMKKSKAKIKKVIKGLKKASKLHAGQAKTLKGVIGGRSKKRNG